MNRSGKYKTVGKDTNIKVSQGIYLSTGII